MFLSKTPLLEKNGFPSAAMVADSQAFCSTSIGMLVYKLSISIVHKSAGFTNSLFCLFGETIIDHRRVVRKQLSHGLDFLKTLSFFTSESPKSPEYLRFWFPRTTELAKFTAVFSLLDWRLIWNAKPASDHWGIKLWTWILILVKKYFRHCLKTWGKRKFSTYSNKPIYIKI